jgi:hypothetical protein
VHNIALRYVCQLSLAPPAAVSVNHLATVEQASKLYRGLPAFKPMEVFEEETSRSVMGLLLLHDLSQPFPGHSVSVARTEPLRIMSSTAFHGGAWRCGVKFGGLGIPATLIAYLRQFVVHPYLVAYNGLQACGWGYVLAKAALALGSSTGGGLPHLCAAVRRPLFFFQRLASLEIAHSLLGALALFLSARHETSIDCDLFYIWTSSCGLDIYIINKS